MLIDHIGAGFLLPCIQNSVPFTCSSPSRIDGIVMLYRTCRAIGRIAFPIFCFLLVEGFFHTHDRRKYALRLGIFALISEIPFNLAFSQQWSDLSNQNVFFTLFLSVLMLMGIETSIAFFNDRPQLWAPAKLLCFLIASVAAFLLQTDYSYVGVLAVFLIYSFRSRPFIGTLLACFMLILSSPTEIYALCVPFLVLSYNGKRGLPLKYFFYAFYPVHLVIISLVTHFFCH